MLLSVKEGLKLIEFFGKIRYHWQPELSWSIIYWSMTFIPIFMGLSMLYEKITIPYFFFIMVTIFGALLGLGVHRYFVIREEGILEIVTSKFWKKEYLLISEIAKVEVTKTSLTFFLKTGDERLFYMRKWPKKYFLDALAINPFFKGEVELTDNFITLDYFNHYHK